MKRITKAIGIITSTVMLTGCGGSAEPPENPEPSSPAETVDPLEGEWLQTYTCEDNVRTFIANMQLIPMEARKGMAETTGLSTALPGLIDYYIRDFAWGPNARTSTEVTPSALCTGAEKRTMAMRVGGGSIVFLSEQEEAHVIAYEVLNDYTVALDDGLDIVDYRFRFRIEGDHLWFEQLGEQDPWDGTVPERAPFVRVSTPTETADPLEGEWQTQFTCQEIVRTLKRESDPKLFDRWTADLVQAIFTLPEKPPLEDLCGEAGGSVNYRLRFENGTFGTWNAEDPEVSGFPTYELIEGEDAFIGRDDGSGNWTEEAKVTYRIVGDRLTLDVHWPSPWEVSTLEPGTWIRVN